MRGGGGGGGNEGVDILSPTFNERRVGTAISNKMDDNNGKENGTGTQIQFKNKDLI